MSKMELLTAILKLRISTADMLNSIDAMPKHRMVLEIQKEVQQESIRLREWFEEVLHSSVEEY